MSRDHRPGSLQQIPLAQIEVLNPRERNAQAFEAIVENIRTLGLKKPITVTPRPKPDGSPHFLLICGEGRLKAFGLLGHARIPAHVVEVSDEDAFIMSLVENIARRKYSPLELLDGIDRLRVQGYDKKTIAAKTGLSPEYVSGLLNLLINGEQRLLAAVGTGKIALNAALMIAHAGDDDKGLQAALQEAYESGQLRGTQLIQAQRLVQRRKTLGRSMARSFSRNKGAGVTSSSLVRSYQKEMERQKLLIKRANFAQQGVLFITQALRQLYADEHFATLLRAEGLDTLPELLAERVWPKGSAT